MPSRIYGSKLTILGGKKIKKKLLYRSRTSSFFERRRTLPNVHGHKRSRERPFTFNFSQEWSFLFNSFQEHSFTWMFLNVNERKQTFIWTIHLAECSDTYLNVFVNECIWIKLNLNERSWIKLNAMERSHERFISPNVQIRPKNVKNVYERSKKEDVRERYSRLKNGQAPAADYYKRRLKVWNLQ